MEEGANMRLDPAIATTVGSPEEVTLHGSPRLLRDLVAVGLMQQDRPAAHERLESKLGGTLAEALSLSLRVRHPDQAHRHVA
jgi:hypothetical protein